MVPMRLHASTLPGHAAPGCLRRVKALKETLSCQVGFHAHNNLGVAIGNSLSALEAVQINSMVPCVVWARCRNAPTELLATVLDKMDLNPGLDVYKLMDAAEYVIAPMMPFQPSPIATLLPSVTRRLLHLSAPRRPPENAMYRSRDILMELGRRQAVAGQEDWILDVALELPTNNTVHPQRLNDTPSCAM